MNDKEKILELEKKVKFYENKLNLNLDDFQIIEKDKFKNFDELSLKDIKNLNKSKRYRYYKKIMNYTCDLVDYYNDFKFIFLFF